MFYEEYSSETFFATVEKYLNSQFVQPVLGQMTKILELTTLTNHIEILSRCKSYEERLFYILYANKEHLAKREMQRCISNQTYATLLSRKGNMSNENPSIGIVLCPEADCVVVEYAMSRSMSPTMTAEYKRILIPQERMQQQLNEFCDLFLDK